jgi:signal transduction histidine kinase
MFTSPSQEFLSLCQAQLTILNQNCGAGLSAVYLTTDFAGEQLIPVAVYPDASAGWEPEIDQPQNKSQSPVADESALGWLAKSPLLGSFMPRFPSSQPASADWSDSSAYENTWQDDQGTWQRQVVMPLIYEGLAMGLLVTGRSDRPWRPKELGAVEKIAHSLAIARLLDQRSHWLNQQLTQQRTLATDHRDHLDNLLHQIRNPLTAIKTFGKLLLRRLLPADPNRSVITGLVQESDRLQSLLRQLDHEIEVEHRELTQGFSPALAPAQSMTLPPAQSEAGIVLEPLVLGVVDLNQILAPLLVSAQAIAQDRGLSILTDLPDPLPLVIADISALREVLSNLLDNALKYNIPQGLVFVKTQPEPPGFLCVGITNTGQGIPATDLPHLFQRHYRGVQETSSIPGTGLGLAIAHQLLEQMGGKIMAFSPADPLWANLQGSDYPKHELLDELPAAAVLTSFLVYLPLA